ncbi:transcriptional regulator [Mycobacteroides abscessus subsp. abscessus]|uniref:GntR family transcriptional regulator n=1 Tax=Mycobacteriaceae TaxID=1762 RepID=UPI0006B35D2C|nr:MULTISPECIES: GntR family transcriptional regulator [Mycobacteriaceae]KAB7754417.1 hypothetical protein MMUC44124_21670 [Mycolicibacterium mucogenicum DSM 44124]SLE89923.1 transcriptional regulator [Mycobacteroides abscessus subsp. abscessus]
MYRQMYRYLRGQIEAGVYAVGDQLPAPEQIEQQFTRRSTLNPTDARHAYAQLISDGLVGARGDHYIVSALTPPPVQSVAAAVDRLDALEDSLTETLVALRRLRGELAGIQTPSYGQWWQVRSTALGADASDTDYAVLVHDAKTGEPHWLATISNTWVKKPLAYFEPLRRCHYIEDWEIERHRGAEPTAPTSRPPAETAGPTAATVIGAAYYATDEQHDAYGDYPLYGPEQGSEGFST